MLTYVFFILAAILPAHAVNVVSCPGEDCNCPNADEILSGEAFQSGPISYTCIRLAEMFRDFGSVNSQPTGCQDNPPGSPPTLYDLTVSTFPRGCGYRWQGFDEDAFRQTISRFMRTGEVLCGGNHHSMCTSAVFLAFLGELRRRNQDGRISDAMLREQARFGSPAYNYINSARPDLLMIELGLGTTRTLYARELPDQSWPREGDIVQLWRHSGYGHSVIFAGYESDSNGTQTGMCYWSSSDTTNGYGRRCEPLSVIDRLIVGRFNP